jgi:nickel-dependent lactate racemase
VEGGLEAKPDFRSSKKALGTFDLMTLYAAKGGPELVITQEELRDLLRDALDKLGERRRVLALPPDLTRRESRAGELTYYAYEYYGRRLEAILPALGTHVAMSSQQLASMFGETPLDLFRVHNWRTDTEMLGEVPSTVIYEQSEGKLDYAWPAQVNRLISHGDFDLVLSLGQVVPHEVSGMANYNKNILIGTGGPDSISRSHYLGAVFGMERIMGRAENPVRNVLNYASEKFLKGLPIVYVLTVVGVTVNGKFVLRGLFIGDDIECFRRAADLSLRVNFAMLDQPISKAVVFLDPREYHSTWLGNKAIYRTRMALADGADLVILAPGVKQFGEDRRIDALIRKYGYRGTPATLAAVKKNVDLGNELGAAAHLIHGSSEDRFSITWCPGHLTREEVEGVGFGYGDLSAMLSRYDPAKLQPGRNIVDGEEVFFISNPGLGLWAYRGRLEGATA